MRNKAIIIKIMIMIMMITIIFITILNSFLITLIPWMSNSIEVALDDNLNIDLDLNLLIMMITMITFAISFLKSQFF